MPGGGRDGGGSKAAAVPTPPKADDAQKAWYKNRPKGGVKVLGGTEGALGKRPAEEPAADQPAAKQPAA